MAAVLKSGLGLLLIVRLLAPSWAAGDTSGAIQFTPVGGVFTNAVSLRLSVESPNLKIRYTLDGREPSLESAVYSSPIAVTNTMLVRARSFEANTNNASGVLGPVVSQSY